MRRSHPCFLASGLLTLMLGLAGPGDAQACSTPAINPYDTYVVTNVTWYGQVYAYLDSPIYDPTTGQTTTTLVFNLPTQTTQNTLGYDWWGQFVSGEQVTSAIPGEGQGYQLNSYGDATGDHSVEDQLVVHEPTGACAPMPPTSPDGASVESPLHEVTQDTGLSITGTILVENPLDLAATGVVESLGEGKLQVTTFLPDGGGAEVVRIYELEKDLWMLTEVRSTSGSAERGFRAENVMRLAIQKWHTNAEADAARAERARLAGRTLRAPGDPSATLRAFLPSLAGKGLAAAGAAKQPEAGTATVTQGLGGPNLVLQHGGFSNAGTWERMDPWLSSTYQFGTKLLPSLSSTARIDDQVSQLIPMMDATGSNQFIMIGHSNGGLISRRTGQQRPDLVRGVVTISSPNNGMVLAQSVRDQVSNALNSLGNRLYAGCYSPFDDPGCFLGAVLQVPEFRNWAVNYAFDAAVPVSGDVRPGSGFLASLNGTPENFTRVGIVNIARSRWVLFRLIGDALQGCNEQGVCAGRTWYSWTNAAFIGFRSCAVISAIFGYWSWYNFCNTIASRMDAVDGFWNRFYAANRGGDGVVDAVGQEYYAASYRYPISNADSHVGETKSDKVRAQLNATLDRQFFVPRNALVP